jgi:imidazolonepropionase-like amidohydrolase
VTPAEKKARSDLRLKIVGAMHRAGVRLLAGADAPNPYTFPGFGLHEELELFVEAGLTPLEALRTATLNPAEFLGKEKTLGTIEKGKFADLVLLDANPLEDIKNTTRIAAVVANGKYLPKSELEKLLAQVEAFVKK